MDRCVALVIEIVEGDDLAEHLAGGRLTLEDGLPIARQSVDALDAAHGQGIIPRDLKPADVRVWSDGVVTSDPGYGVPS